MKNLNAAITAARLFAKTTGLSLSSAVKALSLKADVIVGFFLRSLFLSDDASVSESNTIDVTKNLSESPSAVDQEVISLLKKVSDAGVLSDSDVITIIKGLSESPSITEAHLTALTKPITDTGAITEVASLQSVKPITEAPSATDSDTLELTKIVGDDTDYDYCDLTYFAEDYVEGPRVDRAFVAESNVISMTKFLSDQTFTTDDLDGEASADDDQEITFVKTRTEIASVTDLFNRDATYSRNFAENGSVSESAVKLTTKVHADSGVLSDSGSLRSQGYCDFTYFAEDYVGASRTFT